MHLRRWLTHQPTTLVGTIGLFAVVHAVFQGVLQALFAVIFREKALAGLTGWAFFVVLSAGVGATVGALWYGVQRWSRGWLRSWAEISLGLVGFMMAISVRYLARSSSLTEWLLVHVVGTSVLMGALYAGVARLWARPVDRPTPMPQPATPPSPTAVVAERQPPA